MGFQKLGLKGIYRTSVHSLMQDFYLPVLGQAVRYDRAVGFFSSSMLIEAAAGLSGLIRNGGRMRLVIGHPLSDEDWGAVKAGAGLAALQDRLFQDLLVILEQAGGDRSTHALELLSWMVATGTLEVKYAFRKVGMYHEKIGILTDREENQVVFHGSANESANALLPERNFESLAVYPSWHSAVFQEYGAPFVQGFLDLWDNKTVDVLTVDVPSKFYEALIEYRKGEFTTPDLGLEQALLEQAELLLSHKHNLPCLPRTIGGEIYKLRDHQIDALSKWVANSYSGIFALATGAGKTITVLHAATRFVEQNYRVALVVAVPYQVLAEQWVRVMESFGMEPIKAFYSASSWTSRLNEVISNFLADAAPFLCVVVVNDTLASPTFQECLSRIPSDRLFFVGDECHHHASRVWADRIPLSARYRVGLSATPWNPNREDHKAALERLYGPVVATYTLKDALNDKVLCPYTYHWIPCEIEDDEGEEYVRVSAQMAALAAQDPLGENDTIQFQIQTLSSRRTRLLGSLRHKLTQLVSQLSSHERHPHTLIYCADGFHPLDKEAGVADRNIEQVTQYLAETGWKVGRITATESVGERERILRSFDDGFIEAVAAMRVLDEGFDIPSCRTAYILASSNSYRQYVQRRGRVLRRAPGKRNAEIYDFVALPSSSLISANPTIWRRQVQAELARVRDFIALAENSTAQQFALNNELQSRGLGAIYYSEAPIDMEELYGN